MGSAGVSYPDPIGLNDDDGAVGKITRVVDEELHAEAASGSSRSLTASAA